MIQHRGVAYYPEYWPGERWDEDIRLMKKAGINLVRIGEFAWTEMEVAEGHFTLDWLHTVVRKMAAAGINVLMCTPTAAPPAWLTHQYPDTLIVGRDGKRASHGGRRHYCPTSSTYRRHVARVVERLAAELSTHSNVIGWQIDNELGPESPGFCHCDHCVGLFRAYLQQRYGTLEALNAAWQTKFWSVRFTAWEQVTLRLAGGYPSIELDIRRFHSDSFYDFAAQQAGIIRRLHPKALVSTNMMGPIYTPLDNHKQAELYDMVCDDLYFDIATQSADALAMDLYRNMAPGKPFWITETGSAALSSGKGPSAAQMRAWAFSAMARGSVAHIFFRWRTCLGGQEQNLQGIIETSGRPRRRYKAVASLFNELAALEPKLARMPLPKAQVAIVHDIQSHWAFETGGLGKYVASTGQITAMHEALYERNILADIIPPDRPLKAYKLVLLPSMCIVGEEFAEALREYVRGGGVVLVQPQLATRDANSNYHPRCAPDGLQDVMGLRVESHYYLDNACEADQALWVPAANVVNETATVKLGDDQTGQAVRYIEDIELETARAIGTFADNSFAGQPAVTVNKFGRGAAYYLAAFVDKALLDAMLTLTLERAGVEAGPYAPKYVEVVRRGNITFAINHRREAAEVEVGPGEVIVGQCAEGIAKLPAYGVCVVRTK